MSKKKQLIIPIFIPFGGCEHKCVFCNQEKITGKVKLPNTKEVEDTIEKYLTSWEKGKGRDTKKREGRREIAFYGGSFTGLDKDLQREYLAVAYEFIKKARVDALRISTRPDLIDKELLSFLKSFKVETIELGVQSFSDEVLRLSGRGHTSGDILRAVSLIKEAGLVLGIQLMPGLPGDGEDIFLKSVRSTVEVAPDFVRLYPTIVIKDTPLEALYLRGEYTPWSLERMVDVCREALEVFSKAQIRVIRVGLHVTEDLLSNFVAGPLHPSFRDLLTREASLTE
ncbi:MAG: radical SAM protein [Deltaproteobacteria bacterium]|nr:radical SAM protein [Deltaproteobacteria bacterium]